MNPAQQPQMNPMLQPVLMAYQEKMNGYKQEFEATQNMLKRTGTDFSKVMQ